MERIIRAGALAALQADLQKHKRFHHELAPDDPEELEDQTTDDSETESG
jgi:hypothetical protein